MELTPQQRAVVECDSNRFVVAASAGSGKTTVLRERYLRHVIQDGIRPDQILTITFTRKAAFEMKARIVADDPEAICRAALMGLGVAMIAVPYVERHLETGALQRLLPDWYADLGAISLYFASRKLLPAKTRAFVDHVTNAFRAKHLARRFSAER